MKNCSTPLGLFALTWLALLPLYAEESPLEVVQRFRARGRPDQLLEYLLKLQRNPLPELEAILPFEIAKARLGTATTEPDQRRRTLIQNHARSELEAFIRAKPNHPLAAAAALEIARSASLQGQSQLNRARQVEERDAQRVALAKARLQLEEADRQVQAAAAQIQFHLAALVDVPNSQLEMEQQSLREASLQAEFEHGIILLRLAQCCVEAGGEASRIETLKKAIEALKKLAARREAVKNPLCWQALAWLGYCQLENEDPKAARQILADVVAETGNHAETGRRLARYFRLQVYARDPDLKNSSLQIQQACEEWLRIYPEYSNTVEGYGVKFELANAYLAQAKKQQSKRSLEIYEKSRRLFQALEQTENEFSARAHESKLSIILIVSQQRTKGDITKLKDFQECYLRAKCEITQLDRAVDKSDGIKSEEERGEHFRNIVLALGRGLELADGQVPLDELNEARYLITYAYLVTGDYDRAASCGGELARTQPNFPHAPLAGAYALQSYNFLIAGKERIDGSRADLGPVRERMRSLAQYIEQTWPNDPAADTARHTLGMLLLAEKKCPEAVETLDRISSKYSDLTLALNQLANAALQAENEGTKPPPDRPSYLDRAIAALVRIPPLSPQAEPSAMQIYFAAKLMLADIYFRTKQHEKVEALAETILKRLECLDEKTKAGHRANILAVKLYAELGRAEADYTAGRYTQVREILDPLIKQMKDPAQGPELAEVKEKNPNLMRALLGLALRANMQGDRISRGLEVLRLLQEAFPQNSAESVIPVVQQLNHRLQRERQQGEPAKQESEKTMATLSIFLEEWSRLQEKSPAPDVVLFLAGIYSSLDDHQKAAEWANRIDEPRPAPGMQVADPKEVQLYHVARLLYVRELRLAKEFEKAASALKTIQSAPWGQANLEARKERILLLEDQEKFAGKEGAILAWNTLMQQLRPHLSDNKIKEQYFECYYHLTYCIFKNALKTNDPTKLAKDIRIAANFIVKLEAQSDGGGEIAKKRFAELMNKEPLLKEQYDQLKKLSKP
jgi:hypothetical protein